ncbi:pentapeptide repeat-containing protein [Kocuria sabuli]|uniref:pentapeptide repeat-containing protein n=1 Tax=Kocuria sabuli TaxID=3071448 RepID=UPI0034D6990A
MSGFGDVWFPGGRSTGGVRGTMEVLTALSQPWATVIGGCIVAVGALLGFRASMKTRETMADTANRTHEREVMSARQNRYTTAAEQLSSEHETVRLAGIYALAALADEWQAAEEQGHRDVSVKLMCSYLRGRPRPGGGQEGHGGDDREVRNAIISMISAHRAHAAGPTWPDSLIDLKRAVLIKVSMRSADLHGLNFTSANLAGADLMDADLRGADLRGAHLENAYLKNAKLGGSDLRGAVFRGADLTDADLTDADLTDADVGGVDLARADRTRTKGLTDDGGPSEPLRS